MSFLKYIYGNCLNIQYIKFKVMLQMHKAHIASSSKQLRPGIFY